MSALVLHEYPPSGNCYKIRLTAAHLGIALERRHYDIMAGETRTPEFRADLPTLVLPPGGDQKELAETITAHDAAFEERRLTEERRLLYVALTRSESVLLVSGHLG